MFDREDWPGIMLLGLCALVAIALLIEIFTDYEFTFSGPNWLGNGIAIIGIGLILLMSWRAWGNRIKRWRGQGGQEWPHNDVQSRRKSPRTNDDETPSSTHPTAEQPDRNDSAPR